MFTTHLHVSHTQFEQVAAHFLELQPHLHSKFFYFHWRGIVIVKIGRESAPRSRNFKIREIEFFLGVCPRAGFDRNISAEYQYVTHNRTRYTSAYVQLFCCCWCCSIFFSRTFTFLLCSLYFNKNFIITTNWWRRS